MMKLGLVLLLLSISIVLFQSLAFAANDTSIESLLQKGLQFAKDNKFQDALPYFDKVLEIDPKNINALNLKGAMLGQLDQYDNALSYFDKVLEIDPKNVGALSNKGATLLKLNKYQDALPYFDKVLEIDPKNQAAYINRMIILENVHLIPIEKTQMSGFVQIQVRNANGQLVSYLESNNIGILDLDVANRYLDSLHVKKTIIMNGKSYNVIEIDSTLPEDKFRVIALNEVVKNDPLTNATITMMADSHNGIPVEEGDSMIISWTVFRPVH